MRIPKLRVLLGIFLFVVLGLYLNCVRMFGDAIHHDYARLPPAQAFKHVFHRLPTEEIHELAAAGESSLGGSNVWLRFRASPETIAALVREAKKDTPWKLGDSMTNEPSLLVHYDVLNRLDWGKSWKLQKADFYTSDNGQYSRCIAVDRATGTVYAYYFSI